MHYLSLVLCLVVGGLGGEDLLFLGPGFGSFLKSDLIDLWSEDPIDCDIPHYPLFNGDPELNQIQGPEGAVINGKVTLCGGWYIGPPDSDHTYNSNTTNACFSLDPDSREWESFPGLHEDGHDGDSVMLPDGRWWIIGGFNDENDYYDDTTELYTEGQGWAPGPTLPMINTYNCAANLGENFTLIAGGASPDTKNKTWLYDWGKLEYQEVMDLDIPAQNHACIALDDENVMMAGGYSYSAGHGTLNTVSVFNLGTLAWTPVNPLPQPLQHHEMVRDGPDVLALGGISGGGRIYRYKVGSGWSLENKMMTFDAYNFPALLVTRDMLGC